MVSKYTPRVYVGPDDPNYRPGAFPEWYYEPYYFEWIKEGIRRAGGEVVSYDEADSVVWFGEAHELEAIYRPEIKWIQVPHAGIETWLTSSLMETGAVLTCARGAMAYSVAEHALALLLSGARRIPDFARTQQWGMRKGVSIRESTVVVVGAGAIGTEFIRMIAPLGAYIVAVTRTGRPVEGAQSSCPISDLNEILPEGDFFVFALPETEETRNLIAKAEFSKMKNSAQIVNVGRGATLNTNDLLAAVRNGTIAGASLDVTDPEPLPDGHPLWREPNILITPHTSNLPRNQARSLANRTEENVRNAVNGLPFEGVFSGGRIY